MQFSNQNNTMKHPVPRLSSWYTKMVVIILSIYVAHPVHSFVPSSCIMNERKLVSTITLQGGGVGRVGNDEENLDAKIISLQSILNRASKTKKEDPDLVMNTLEDLEKKMR